MMDHCCRRIIWRKKQILCVFVCVYVCGCGLVSLLCNYVKALAVFGQNLIAQLLSLRGVLIQQAEALCWASRGC